MKRTAFFCAVAGCVFLADAISMAGLPEGRWAHPSPSPEHATAKTLPLEGRSSLPVRLDSTRRSVAAGEVLITTLPAQVEGRAVSAYDMLRTPARSNLAGRSFFWRTRPRDAGRYRLLFRARFADSTASDSTASDTLAVLVTVE